MKKNYLIYFFFFVVLNLQAQNVFIELVDENVGVELPGNVEGDLLSNDDGLNTILQNYNVINYNHFWSYRSDFMQLRTTVAYCNTSQLDQLIEDLNAYNSVVKFAAYFDQNEWLVPNGLWVSLLDESVGIYEETNNGLIVTNDAGLNQIFSDFNVRVMEYITYYDNYEIVCDCDAALLKQELDNYASVISSTQRIDGAILLSTNDFNIKETKVYPNPFTNKVYIKTNSQISSVTLYDILGKQIYTSSSVSEFETFSSSLKSGVYILNITDIKQQSITKKLVKG